MTAEGMGPHSAADSAVAGSRKRARPICMKCKCKPAEVAARQREPLCRGCLCDGLVSKARGGVRGSNSVAPGDTVLAALSGGAASQAMLYFLQQMHNKDKDRLERGQVAFDLQAIHIPEAGTNSSPTCHEAASGQRESGQAPEQLVTTCRRARVPLTVAPLEAVFWATDQNIPLDTPNDMRHLQKDLQCLLQAVTDPTGKEDLLAALRKALLLRLARQLSCNKVAIGTSATRMAVRTVAMSAKGSGYALSGAIHFTDSRELAAKSAAGLLVWLVIRLACTYHTHQTPTMQQCCRPHAWLVLGHPICKQAWASGSDSDPASARSGHAGAGYVVPFPGPACRCSSEPCFLFQQAIYQHIVRAVCCTPPSQCSLKRQHHPQNCMQATGLPME
ncbi:hypothetical protein ABBQ32_012152 [Trebouxia sp. C0010 RCD-2024]